MRRENAYGWLLTIVAATALAVGGSLLMQSAAPVRTALRTGAATTGYRMYMEALDGSRLDPVDATTLKDTPGARSIPLSGSSPSGFAWLTPSSDGSTLLVQPAAGGTIDVVDPQTGQVRAEIHPPKGVFIDSLSADGSRAYALAPGRAQTYWTRVYAYSTADGSLIRSLHVKVLCCGPILFDPAADRFIALRETQSTRDPLHDPPNLLAYSLSTGRVTGRLRLDGLLAGWWPEGQTKGDTRAMAQWEPGLALSPDGRWIDVIDASRGLLQRIDARSMTIDESMALSSHSPSGILSTLGQWLGLVPTAAEAKAFDGTMLSMQFSPDGRWLYVTGVTGHIGNRGKFSFHGMSLRTIDAQSGAVVAQALVHANIWRLTVAPDGSAVYVVPGPRSGGCPCNLERLDASTLQVTARRTIGDDMHLPETLLLAAPKG